LKESGKVYAIDVQKDLLRRILNDARKQLLDNVHILWGDLEKPHGSKLADRSVDLVLVSNILFQVEHKLHVLKEAHRILRPRGRLAIIDWKESYGGMGPIKSHVFSENDATTLAERAGFVFQDSFLPGAHHYGLLFSPGHHLH
jgi:ubiquinone/menaquinone biosynthesis C-methylase UbiE